MYLLFSQTQKLSTLLESNAWLVGNSMTIADLAIAAQLSLLYFPHGMNEFVDSEGGFKHPSNLKVIDLVNS